ncbi:MAG: SxtJ family membrane protein [bacterium]|jgi:hypothetical protein
MRPGAEHIDLAEPAKRRLRNFGFTMAVCFAVLGALLLWRGKEICPYFLALAVVFFVLGAFLPRALGLVFRLWMGLALVLSWVMTRVLLCVIFYVGVSPIAIAGRLFGKEFLNLGKDPGARTYWRPKEVTERGPESYERQY